MIEALALGLYAGLSPGPTLTLVIGQSLRYGLAEGLKVAIAPLLTDAPIILLVLWLLGRIGEGRGWLAAIAWVGALVLLLFAIDCFRAKPPEVDAQGGEPRSVLKGFLANLFNPHPWIAWLTVMGPRLQELAEHGRLRAALFLLLFYGVMVGAKMAIAVIVSRGRDRLRGRSWRLTMIGIGLVLLVFAIRSAVDGWHLSGLG